MGIGMLLAALVVGAAGPAYLRRAVDAAARPGVALGAWIGTGVVFVSLLVAAPVVMHVQPLRGFAPAATAVTACATMFDPAASGVWPAAVRGVVVAVAVVAAVSAVAVVVAAMSRARRSARAHARSLRSLVEATDHVDGVRVWWIADDEPVAYALPGAATRGFPGVGRRGSASPGGTVVASTALWDLGEERRRAVLDHEIAHLRGRHHVAVTSAAALRTVFSPVPLLRRAAAEVSVLAELAADRRAALGAGGAAAVRGALGELGAPAGRVAVLSSGPAGPRGTGPGLALALVHAVSPAAISAAAATTLVLGMCSALAG
ncbi:MULTISPECIES: M48 family metalloprotease [Dietzia]|uniref:M48 family metalloprotease n=1 Tax=Dietzia TaxID=37914 RepID=UPI0021176053|nr:M48 family metalloprotease [Dietzia sp. Die43]